MKNKNFGRSDGFVLVELLISMSVATLIMGVCLFGYRVFSNNLAMRAAAQQVAVAIRQAQTQGVATRQITSSADFSVGYGVSFDLSNPNYYIIFADKNGNGKYDGDANCSAGTECLEKGYFKNNVALSTFCGTDTSNMKTCPPLSAQGLNIVFASANQEKVIAATIKFTDNAGGILPGSYSSSEVSFNIAGSITGGAQSQVLVNTTGGIYIDSGSAPTTNHPPVIVLNGENPMSITTGPAFIDPGAVAADTEDGILTSSIKVTGSVNTLIAGTYTLTYSVTDSGGLSATPVTRNVTVFVPAPIITSITPNHGLVGASVVITGSNFSFTGNSIYFGLNDRFDGIASSDGTTLHLDRVPGYGNIAPPCPPLFHGSCPSWRPAPLMPGVYSIYITNTNGTSNSADFTLDPVPSPRIDSIRCTSVFHMTMVGSGFTETDNNITFVNDYHGTHSVGPFGSSDGVTLPFISPVISAGNYEVTVTNANGVSNSKSIFYSCVPAD